MKELLGLGALFAVIMVLFGRVPQTLQDNQTDTDILYSDSTVKSNDLFFGVHIRADDSDGRVSGLSNLGFAGKKTFWEDVFGGFSRGSSTNTSVNSLVASTQTNDLFDDTDSLGSTTFVTPCAVNFEDVSLHNLKNTILTAARYCLVDGYNSSRFYPDNFLRREELSKMTVNMMMLKLEGFVRDFDGIDYDPFVDVPSSNQLAPYMSYVSRLGVWNGLFSDDTNTRFDPEGLVSTQDMITMLTDITRMYPTYTDGSRISLDLSKDWLTRADALDVMMEFFRGDDVPEFAAASA